MIGNQSFDGGPARAVAAAQQHRRLFEHTAFVFASSTDVRQAQRSEALAALITFGGGTHIQLQPGQVVVTNEQQQNQQQQLRQWQQGGGGSSNRGGWRRLAVLCGDMPQERLAQLCEVWGVRDVVNGLFVLDSIVSFQLRGVEGYRVFSVAE